MPTIRSDSNPKSIKSLKHPRVFYGWWVVGACFFIALYVSGVVFYGFTAIFEPIANEFGWSYTQISLAASLRGLEIGLFAPLIGILVDRWGPRRLICSGTIIIGLGLILLSQTRSLGMFYSAFIVLSMGLTICSSAVLIPAVANWFGRKVGVATGIMACGWGFGGLLIPVIVKLTNIFDWRRAMVLLSLPAWFILLPLSFIIRRKPEQYAYLPDGRSVLKEDLALAQAGEEGGARRILRSGTYWRITLAITCYALILSAVITHVMPYLSSIGVARATSSVVASAIPLFSITGRLGFGWLGDKLDKRWAMAGAFALMGLGLLCFQYVPSRGWPLVPFLILFATGYGGNSILRATLLIEYFGKSKFGTILAIKHGSHLIVHRN